MNYLAIPGLSKIFAAHRPSDELLNTLLHLICDFYNVEVEDLPRSRQLNVYGARNAYGYFSVKKYNASSVQAGEVIGKSHCQILRYMKNCKSGFRIYKEQRLELFRLEKKLNRELGPGAKNIFLPPEPTTIKELPKRGQYAFA